MRDRFNHAKVTYVAHCAMLEGHGAKVRKERKFKHARQEQAAMNPALVATITENVSAVDNLCLISLLKGYCVQVNSIEAANGNTRRLRNNVDQVANVMAA